MQNRTAKFCTALAVTMVAGAALTALSAGPASAECLTGPKGATPAGAHWRYRIDHATKRNCWYLAGLKQAPAQESSEQAAAEEPAAAPAPAPAKKPALPRQVSDARAELQIPPARTELPAAAGPSFATPGAQSADSLASNALVAAAPRWTMASRWADQGDATVASDPASMSSAPPAAEAPTQVAEAVAEAPPVALPVQAAEPIRAAANASDSSIHMLLIVLAASLGLAGIIAAVIHFSNPRNRRSRGPRRVNWDMPTRVAEEPPLENGGPDGLPRWLQIARARIEAEHAGQEIEDLLRASRPAVH
jgi:hypothetical protein